MDLRGVRMAGPSLGVRPIDAEGGATGCPSVAVLTSCRAVLTS